MNNPPSHAKPTFHPPFSPSVPMAAWPRTFIFVLSACDQKAGFLVFSVPLNCDVTEDAQAHVT